MKKIFLLVLSLAALILWSPAVHANEFNYYTPYFAPGTGLGLRNLSSSAAASYTVTVYDQAGVKQDGPATGSIPPLGQSAFMASSGSSEGWIAIESSEPLTGLCFFANPAGFMGDIPVGRPYDRLCIAHVAETATTWDMTVMMANPNDSTTNYAVTFVRADGESLTPITGSLSANESTVFDADTLTHGGDYSNGSVIIDASQPVVAFGLYYNTDKVQGGKSYAGISAEPVFYLESSAFNHGEPIPDLHTPSGQDVSPNLTWANAPRGTKSFVLVMDDPDAPGGTYTHWVVYDIPAWVEMLSQDSGAAGAANLPPDASHATNSAQTPHYQGPDPPMGETHHYYFKLYAVGIPFLNISFNSHAQIMSAISGSILGKAELMGTWANQP